MANMLSITVELTFVEILQEYQVLEYELQAGAQLNNAGAEICINIEIQDLFLHPAESYLLIEGRLQKNGGTPYDDADLVTLVHNGVLFLFSSISYRLSGRSNT